jgi:ADP-ribosylglycohydrolase
MIPRGWDEESPLEECRSFFHTEIGRLNPEYPGWMVRKWTDLRKAQNTELTWQGAPSIAESVSQSPYTDSWKKLLGDSAHSQLLGLLQATGKVNDLINEAQGHCIHMPSPTLKSHVQLIMQNLGRSTVKMNINKELSRSEQSAYGAVLGALTGDAAGGVLEFLGHQPTPKECEQAFEMPGGGVFDLAPGQFTDDGEMTVSLLRALVLGQGQYDPLMAAKAYSDWAASEPFDIGNATSSALRIPKSERYGVRAAELIAEQALEYNSESKANGSLMRATPLGIAAANMTVEQTVAMACADARLTHPNPACQASTAAYVLAIRHLIQQPGDHKGAFAVALSHAQSTNVEVSQWLQDAQEGELPPAHPMAGFVRYGFTYAFYYLYRATPFQKAILETLVRGGDTDTNACIVGGLLGALHGMDKIPKSALDKVLACDTRHGQQRPSNYTIEPVLGHMKKLSQLCLGG